MGDLALKKIIGLCRSIYLSHLLTDHQEFWLARLNRVRFFLPNFTLICARYIARDAACRLPSDEVYV